MRPSGPPRLLLLILAGLVPVLALVTYASGDRSIIRIAIGVALGVAVALVVWLGEGRLLVQRRLLARLARAQEEERRRIASDIHDDPLQLLSGVRVRLDAVRRRLADPEDARALARVDELVSMAITRLRRLAFELSPPELERRGLAEALRQFVTETAPGIRLEIEDRLGEDPPPEPRSLLYRIAREALTNVRRHARASRVEVRIQERDGGILVRVRDDGVGFSMDRVHETTPSHLGLATIKRRAEMAGGRSEVRSAPGAGTTVEVWVPLERDRVVHVS